MLEKPDIQEDSINSCLRDEFGLNIKQITFLPLGNDLSTAVYRAEAEDGNSYFCKVKCESFDEMSVELPKFLKDQGIEQIIAPMVTQEGQLWAELDTNKLVLYPYVEGTSGFDITLSERQWADFGAALKQIHTTIIPPELSHRIRKENFSSSDREICMNFLDRISHMTADDPIMVKAAELLMANRERIIDIILRAERLAPVVASGTSEWVLCHSDIHPGNLFLDVKGQLFIVDWDYPRMAPKECDLMFIGGGEGFVGCTAQDEERLFYQNYGEPQIDPIAFAYFRCERGIKDLAVECERIFSESVSDQDRAFSLQVLGWYFGSGGTIEMAVKSSDLIFKLQ